jgi:hypothetical protein
MAQAVLDTLVQLIMNTRMKVDLAKHFFLSSAEGAQFLCEQYVFWYSFFS